MDTELTTNGELFSGHGWKVILEDAPLPDGRIKRAARVQRADSVHILAFPKKDTVLLLKEFRPYYGTHIWMLPSGRVDKETDIHAAAQRELQEETGFRAEKLTFYCKTNYSESMIMTNHLFLARNLISSPLPQDNDEMIEVHAMGLEEAIERVCTSPKVHTVSAYGLLRFIREKT